MWEGNIRIYLKEAGVDTSKLIDSGQDREDYWRTLAMNLGICNPCNKIVNSTTTAITIIVIIIIIIIILVIFLLHDCAESTTSRVQVPVQASVFRLLRPDNYWTYGLIKVSFHLC